MKINLLVQQLAEDGGGREGGRRGADDTAREAARKVRALEKEVHHYRKLCRELRSRHGDQEVEVAAVDRTRSDPDRAGSQDRAGSHDRAEPASDGESVVSRVQPSQLQQLQRRLAALQRRGDQPPRPTVTR